MVMSFPTSKLGIAIGIRAPCSRPRLKPAGFALCSREAETRLSTQPMAAAASRIVSTRRGILHHGFRAVETLACVSLTVSVEQKHVFELPGHASRIFRCAGAVPGGNSEIL